MKRADPQGTQDTQETQDTRPTNPTTRPRPSANTSNDFGDAVRKLGNWLVRILTFPVQIFTFLTNAPGSAIALGLGVLCFALLNIEGYWLAIPSDVTKVAFIPKPFLDDGGDFRNLSFAASDAAFWFAALISMVVQGVQAQMLREASIAKAKADYDAVAQYTVPEANPQAIDLAELRRQKYKKIGVRTARQRGVAILVVYALDTGIAFANFPLLGLPSSWDLVINVVWAILAVFGCELAINLFLDALSHTKENRKPKSEVV